jgi:plastocyanin domain-containing protein
MMRTLIGLFALLALFIPAANAADEIAVTIKGHKFSPDEIHIPANQAVVLKVTNEDPTPEEFESHDFDVEKVIAGGQSAVIRLQPLDVGPYRFYGEYHEDTAQGVLVAE